VVIFGGALVMFPVRVPLLLIVPLLVRVPPSVVVTVPLLVKVVPDRTVRLASWPMVRLSPSPMVMSSCKVTAPYTVPFLPSKTIPPLLSLLSAPI